MIEFQGALRVKKVHGRHGEFSVGTLSSDLGEFKVKDALLEPFDEGRYQVTAWVTRIYLRTYMTSWGNSLTELCAHVEDLQVHDEQLGRTAEAEPASEPDPLDETPPLAARPAPETPLESIQELKAKLARISAKPAESEEKAAERAATSSDDPGRVNASAPSAPEQSASQDGQALFRADQWALIQTRQPIKLDTTDDRETLRQQSVLSRTELGYQFRSRDQQTFFPL